MELQEIALPDRSNSCAEDGHPGDLGNVERLPYALQNDVRLAASLEGGAAILESVRRLTGMRFAVISRVTDTRWIACQVADAIDFGLQPGGELPIETTLCSRVLESSVEIVIDDARSSEGWMAHPIPKLYGFRSYLSVPIVCADGEIFGTLCAIDPEPARLHDTPAIEAVRLFAGMLALQLDDKRRLMESESALEQEQAMARLREEFIAVLGHDLRNPLSAIGANAELLENVSEDDTVIACARTISRSVTRMAGLTTNLLDFARVRFGAGLELDAGDSAALNAELRHVIDEIAARHPGRVTDVVLAPLAPFPCDSQRLGQMLSNLLGNAVHHGDASSPVRVRSEHAGNRYRLSVANGGDPLPEKIGAALFQPFRRSDPQAADRSAGKTPPIADGLGLGLYIANQIATAHGGRIDVDHRDGKVVFSFSMAID